MTIVPLVFCFATAIGAHPFLAQQMSVNSADGELAIDMADDASASSLGGKYLSLLRGPSYCSNYIYLPEGKYPQRLNFWHWLRSDDPEQECMQRCTHAAAMSSSYSARYFWLTHGTRCGCAIGSNCGYHWGIQEWSYAISQRPNIGALKYRYLGPGYCTNYRYLPQGKYPPHLKPWQPGYHKDKLQECSQRCQMAYKGTKAFFVEELGRLELCACAGKGDSCSSRKPNTPKGYDYWSFSITG